MTNDTPNHADNPSADEPLDGSIEDSGLDLSPRATTPRRPPRTGSKRWLPIGVLVIVLAAGGIILAQFLRSAVDYYCNVDEIDVRNGCEAGRRLRVQGIVDEGTVKNEAGFTLFSMSFNDESLDVRYRGEPIGMFNECEPVVVHGRLDDDGTFVGDSIDVKHSNEYEAEHPDRVPTDGAPNCPAPA